MIEYFKINADCTCWMKSRFNYWSRQFWTSMEILKGPLALLDGTLNKFYLTSSWLLLICSEGIPHGSDNKETACRKKKERRKKKEKKKKERNCLQCRRPGFNPWVRKIPWRKEWQTAPVFLPGEFHGQEHGGLQSLELQRIGRDWETNTLTFTNLFRNLFRNLLLSFFLNGNISLALTWRL